MSNRQRIAIINHLYAQLHNVRSNPNPVVTETEILATIARLGR